MFDLISQVRGELERSFVSHVTGLVPSPARQMAGRNKTRHSPTSSNPLVPNYIPAETLSV